MEEGLVVARDNKIFLFSWFRQKSIKGKGEGGGWRKKITDQRTANMGGGVVKTNWQNLLGGLIKFLSWHNWSPLTLPSHPTQATDDDRSLKKVRNFNPRPR